MKNVWITVLIALCAGAVSGILAVALTANRNVAKTSSSRIEESDSISPKDSPTVIEHQVIVHDPTPVSSANTAATKMETPAPKVYEVADLAADLESMFQNDHGSGEDGRKSESLLRTALGNPSLKGVRVDRIDCKAVTCRVELTFDSHEADVEVLQTLANDPKGLLSHDKSMTIPIRNTTPDGKIAATMYYYPSLPAPPRPGASPPT